MGKKKSVKKAEKRRKQEAKAIEHKAQKAFSEREVGKPALQIPIEHRHLLADFPGPKPKPPKQKTAYSGREPPIPPPQLLDLIHNFLKDFKYIKAAHGVRTDNQKRPGHNMQTWKWSSQGLPNLLEIFLQWQEQNPVTNASLSGDDPTPKRTEGMALGIYGKEHPHYISNKTAMEKMKSGMASSDDGSASASDSDALGDMPLQKPSPDKISTKTAITSQLGQKRKAGDISKDANESSSDVTDSSNDSHDISMSSLSSSNPETGSDTDSDTNSDSESGMSNEPTRKKRKTVGNSELPTKSSSPPQQPKSDESSSSSESSVSNSDSNVKKADSVSSPASESSSASSASSSSEEESSDGSASSSERPRTKKVSERARDSVVRNTSSSGKDVGGLNGQSDSSETLPKPNDEKQDQLADGSEDGDSSSSVSSSESDESDTRRAVGKSSSQATIISAEHTTVLQDATNGPQKGKNSFSRIPNDIKVDSKFSSNDYIPYDYADRAYRDLSVTKGKGFTKEKNKKKKGQAFKGGAIDISGGRAVKFED